MHWQPTANIHTLKQRAAIIQKIRTFFFERNVLEVQTPALGRYGVSDFHLKNIRAEYHSEPGAPPQTLFLQTSPEYHMKRLLAAGSGCIFQLGKAYRDEEAGQRHLPEFTMLEWYRVGFDEHRLMDEVGELLQAVLDCDAPERMTFDDVFLKYADVDLSQVGLADLQTIAARHGLSTRAPARDVCLDYLMGVVIEPQLGLERPLFIYDYPASMAALARVEHNKARRFECYVKGVELANGFYELSDSAEQLRRFEADLRLRREAGLPEVEIDKAFLAALESGLPDCAGVALGVDRLVMLALGVDDIREVVAF
jgi:elongation factor P--(R)-beta-lysine ligase